MHFKAAYSFSRPLFCSVKKKKERRIVCVRVKPISHVRGASSGDWSDRQWIPMACMPLARIFGGLDAENRGMIQDESSRGVVLWNKR